MMFFVNKSKKIRKYLDEKTAMGTTTVFDELLLDYLSGGMKTELTALELKRVEIHVNRLLIYIWKGSRVYCTEMEKPAVLFANCGLFCKWFLKEER